MWFDVLWGDVMWCDYDSNDNHSSTHTSIHAPTAITTNAYSTVKTIITTANNSNFYDSVNAN